MAGTETREIEAMVPACVSGAAQGFGVSEFRVRGEKSAMNVPDSQAAPVRPMILAAVNAVEAIVLIFWVDV